MYFMILKCIQNASWKTWREETLLEKLTLVDDNAEIYLRDIGCALDSSGSSGGFMRIQ